MKKHLAYFLLSSLFLCSLSDAKASPKKNKRSESLKAYGKIGVMAYEIDGDLSLENLGSRIGFKAKKKVPDLYLIVYARGEWSFNAVENSADLSVGSNNNFLSDSDVGDAFRRRLGFIGFKSPTFGDLRIGKQWSVYSDVSHYTDAFNIFGGAAAGTYNLNTDGGQSGTGRISKGLTYRNDLFGIQYGLQVKLIQDKNLTIAGSETTLKAKDSYGASLRKSFSNFIEVGIAYNQILMDGDKGAVLGYNGGDSWSAVAGLKLLFKTGQIAITINESKNHEMDSSNEIIDAKGIELYLNKDLSERVSIYAGHNQLRPDEDQYKNDYLIEDYIIGSQYSLKNLKFMIEAKVTNSKNHLNESATNRIGLGTVFKF